MVWSVEDQNKLAELWLKGTSINDIALAINRHADTISNKAMRMGLAKRNKVPKRQRDEAPRRKRKCLKCQQWFWAEKPFYVCKSCKSTTEWRSQGSSFI
jgi:rRNA maturation endonuclease Nob1